MTEYKPNSVFYRRLIRVEFVGYAIFKAFLILALSGERIDLVEWFWLAVSVALLISIMLGLFDENFFKQLRKSFWMEHNKLGVVIYVAIFVGLIASASTYEFFYSFTKLFGVWVGIAEWTALEWLLFPFALFGLFRYAWGKIK